MKKFLKVIIFVIIIFILLFFLGIGGKRTDVFLHDFSVSEDGTKMKLKTGVSSSAGYIRTLYVKQGGDNKYITFFSTFGINNKFGAKNEFEIELNPSCEEIFFYTGDGGYKSVLHKNANGQWENNGKYNNPKVPNGFKKVETETASWEEDKSGRPKGWNNGLVIEDELGNQFVWVPVKNNDFGNFKDEVDRLDDEESLEEVAQIEKYGGFYIARFEAGVSIDMQSQLENISSDTNNTQGITISQKGARPWNFISLNKAKTNATKMYNTEEVTSDLMTTRQWLRMINWIEQSGYDFNDMRKLGNFADSFFNFSGLYSEDRGVTYKEGNTAKGKNYILATGINESAKTNNIYDLFGNLMEFTDGYVEQRGYYSVGGYYSETATLKGTYLLGVEPLDKLGFRVVLYMK